MTWVPASTWRTGALHGGLTLLAAAAGQLLSVLLWMPEPQTHMVWMPGAFTLCALLVSPKPSWPPCLLGAMAGIAGTLAAFGLPLPGLVLIALGDLLMVAGAAALLLRLAGDRPLDSFSLLWSFILICGVALPAVSAWWVIEIAGRTGLGFYLGSRTNVMLAHGIAYLLVVPAWEGHVAGCGRKHRLNVPMATVGATMLLGLWWAWSRLSDITALHPLLIVAPAPLLVWALLVFRVTGACLAMLAVSLLCMWLSIGGEGPFVQQTIAMTILAAQLWVAGVSVALLFLSTLVEQRRGIQRALRETHSELSRMTGRLIAAQEIERANIARDLHDDANQALATISIRLSAIKQDADASLKAQLDGVQHQVIGVSKNIRRLSHQLHPSVLRYTGLVPALLDLCESHRSRGAWELRCELPDAIALPEAHALCLYRIAQEALGNAERHSAATQIVLSLHRDEHTVTLRVTDNGTGWDQDIVAARARGGLGLTSMEERARLLDGTLEVYGNSDGTGSTVCVVLPVSIAAG